ncbi:MAG: hypothetical protein RMJ07_05640 [Nitrososphaerota archaeon]|nr:hypothetical protein [Candidatus Bathyarchaeota archaeon]MDW8049142.1 hypothetical protein [Nitrososphaerota archaeon]
MAANGIVTTSCGIALAMVIRHGKLERNLFYYAWTGGFIAYGLEILLRPFYEPIRFILGGVAYILVALGIWSLTGKKGIIR